MLFVLLLLLPGARLEEATPSSLLSPRNYNHHPFDTVRFLKKAKPTKKGPILFPNDAPPPPPTPLIVTSRPLIESIRRSELNPNNTIQAQSQLNQVTYRPDFLAKLKDYKPYTFNVVTATPVYDLDRRTYSEVVKKRVSENEYDNYEERTLPPLYRALSDHANDVLRRQTKPVYEYQHRPALSPLYRGVSDHINNVLAKQNRQNYNQQVKSPAYSNYQRNNDVEEETSKEYNHGENYAFSYTVKDKKTGDDFSHSQQSSGSATNGEYRVRLPDGRMQIVSYTADENGYKADVRYDDHNDYERTEGNNVDSELGQNNRYEDDYANQQLDDRKYVYTPTYNDHVFNIDNKDNLYVDYVDKTGVIERNRNNDHNKDYLLSDNGNEYLDDNDKLIDKTPSDYNDNINKNGNLDNDYYHYSDDKLSSKEYKDYSTENDYQPHISKYTVYSGRNNAVKSTPKPTYEELKDIFVMKFFQKPKPAVVSSTVRPAYDTQNGFVSSTVRPNFSTGLFNLNSVSSGSNLQNILVSTTASTDNNANKQISSNYDSTTERVVIIGTKKPTLFTNIKNALTGSYVTPTPLVYSTPIAPVASTPSSYLFSTIANLREKINLSSKPVLSNKYIDKINKYLSYK